MINMIKNIKEKLLSVNDFINKNWKIFLFLILAAQIFLLYLGFIRTESFISPDSPGYIAPAGSFLEQGIMLDGLSGAPIWFRTPGYPFFLAVVYYLTGYSNICVIISHMVMCLLNTIMIVFIVRNLTKNNALGIFAAIFYAVDFIVYAIVPLILTDVLFQFLITLTLFLIVKYMTSNQKNKKIYAVLSIFAINYALLVRPALMYLSIIAAFVMLIIIFSKKFDWKIPALYIIVFLAAFGGWTARNYYYHGGIAYSPIIGESYYRWFAPETFKIENNIYKKEGADEAAKEYFQKLMAAKYPDFEKMSKLEQVNAEKDIGGSYLKEHLFAFIKLNVSGFLKELLSPNWTILFENYASMPFEEAHRIFYCGTALLAVLYLIYAFGFIKNIKKLNWLDWIIFLSACYLMSSTAVLGGSRYRMAFYTLCVVGAFTCWKNFYNNKSL